MQFENYQQSSQICQTLVRWPFNYIYQEKNNLIYNSVKASCKHKNYVLYESQCIVLLDDLDECDKFVAEKSWGVESDMF